MKDNFESLDNLELQMRKSSVVQERAGLVAVHMYKQYLEYQHSLINTNDTFLKIIDNISQIIEYLKQSFSVRNIPTQNITYEVDSGKTVIVMNILWHTISFTTRFNNVPKALKRVNDSSPLFCGRIFALNGNVYQILNDINKDDYEAQIKMLLEKEIASLYIPHDKNQNAIMTIRHMDNKEFYQSQVDAGRDFLLKVVEIVCAGGNFHEQLPKSQFPFPKF